MNLRVTSLLCGYACSIALAAERPNLLVFMTDDQRWDAMSCAGNAILKTPGMDRIANEGIRFRNAFVTNALCAPSRATLLTGQYSHTHGVIDNIAGRSIHKKQAIVSDMLSEAGYEVAFCGKSHVNGALRDRKWDYYFGFQGQGDYLKPVIAEGTDGKDQPYDGYIDDVVAEKAATWLKNRKTDRPFCLFVWFKACHRSWLRPRRLMDLYSDVVIPKPLTFDDDLKGYPGKPRAFAEADNKIGNFNDVRTLESFVKDYYATLVAADENIRRVISVLEAAKQLDDTAVFHTGDNGFFLGEYRMFDKRFMHEPSIRVPLIMRYPKLIKPGTLSDDMALNIDIAPTMLDLAGLPIPKWMHGRSLLPLFKGDRANWRKDWLYGYYEFPGPHSVRAQRGVRTDRYKLIHYYNEPQEFELYDLQKDPQERDNLYGRPEHEELVKSLRQRLETLRDETGDSKPER